jgi:DNA-binding MarR family transcriptional regulator
MNTTSTATLLHQTFQCLIEQLVANLQEAGYRDIRVAHSRVFEHLPATGARVARMAEAAQMTQQSMTELVEYLELAGYVERLPDPRDRRAKLVRLTKTGKRLSAAGRHAMRRIDASWEARLGKDRMREMRSALSDVLEFSGRRLGPTSALAQAPRKGKAAKRK